VVSQPALPGLDDALMADSKSCVEVHPASRRTWPTRPPRVRRTWTLQRKARRGLCRTALMSSPRVLTPMAAVSGRQQVDPAPPFPFFVEPLPPAPVCG
jgi:hypothetical protein